MAGAKVELLGEKELEQTFRTLGERVQRKTLRQAVNAGATTVMKAVRAKAPKESGLLKKSIGKKLRTYKSTGTILGVVGPRSDFSGKYKNKKRRPVNYAHLVEKGFIMKNGTHVAAHPFIQPAFDETQAKAQESIRAKLSVAVLTEARKGGRK